MQKVQAILPIGTVLNGHYLIESLLGKGSFGNVYLAWDQYDKQKLFALAELINPKEQEGYHFTLEYVSPTPLDHRAIPRPQYVFFNDDKLGRTCLLMRYSEEPTLEMLRLQQPEQRFPLPQVMSIMVPIMSAVSHLHQQHPPVIHQNIKPASIIMPRTTGKPVLVVLGIVKEQGSTTNPVPYFTPCFGAIEQYSGEFSTRSDIYGLGATFYILLTGIVPPDALYRSTQLDSTEIDLLKPVNEVVPAIPVFIAEAIQQAMAIEPHNRFSSVEQFREALWSVRSQFSPGTSRNEPTTSLPPPATPIARKQTAEKPAPVPEPLHALRPWRLGILIGGLLALLIALIVGLIFWSNGTAGTTAHPATVTPQHTAPAVVTPTSQPTATPTPIPTTPVPVLPTVAGSYNGTIHNAPSGVTSTMSLTNIKQDGGKISGSLGLGTGLLGAGFFTGTVDTARHIQFTVPGVYGNAPLQFSGIVQTDGSLKGSYCSLDQTNHCNPGAGGYGAWNANPA